MDGMTRIALMTLSERFPMSAISLTHHFFDGTEGNPCGFVPNDWDGTTVGISGEWWLSEEERSEQIRP